MCVCLWGTDNIYCIVLLSLLLDEQPSLFSVVRSLVDLFGFQGGDGQLGLYGAFGYDLTFQFEPIKLSQERDPDQRDLLLSLPDKILVVDQGSATLGPLRMIFLWTSNQRRDWPGRGRRNPLRRLTRQKESLRTATHPRQSFPTVSREPNGSLPLAISLRRSCPKPFVRN